MNGIGRYNFRMYLYRCAGRDFVGIHSRLQEQNTINSIHKVHCNILYRVGRGNSYDLVIKGYVVSKAFLFVILESNVASNPVGFW